MTENGVSFEIIRDENGVTRFWLKGPWQNAYFQYFEDGSVTQLFITWDSWLYPFSGDLSLGFIAELSRINSFRIFSAEAISLKPLEKCCWLDRIEIDVPKQKSPINFDCFKNLIFARIKYQKALDGVLSCDSLESLIVENYPEIDLLPLKKLVRLVDFEIVKSKKLQSLRGIELLNCLSSLSLYRCESLSVIDGVPSGIKLQIENCKNIPDQCMVMD